MTTQQTLKTTAEAQLEIVMKLAREWRTLRSSTDRGSFCENASIEHKTAIEIETCLDALIDSLLKIVRN